MYDQRNGCGTHVPACCTRSRGAVLTAGRGGKQAVYKPPKAIRSVHTHLLPPPPPHTHPLPLHTTRALVEPYPSSQPNACRSPAAPDSCAGYVATAAGSPSASRSSATWVR